MSVTITTDVFCDFCGDWEPEATTTGNKINIGEARAKAARYGWVYRWSMKKKKFIDICPKCIEEGNRDRAYGKNS